ncbi:aspartate 4-decarboxylase [Mangrovactinospora gilvigrisea]|uniref:Aminotransferase n=1 Tax=Mangrovactinospora gilvigrisea TaxID=1428644 RepID=A0A1J7CE28_9ACTN|nr:aspartate 4-decarboxylase [Mangrovactinospora gilvigrisea]
MKRYAQLSPFELKSVLIDTAERAIASSRPGAIGAEMLNAGRGNPNWNATAPREAFYALGHFAVEECRRVWTADDLGGMPEKAGVGARFETFVRRHPEMPGIYQLLDCVNYAVDRFGLDRDTLLHELADGITGDNYPVPDRILTCTEKIVGGYLADEMYGGKPPRGLQLFATEGGTAAMCYIFDSLMKNGVLHKGDRIALMTPIFTPYIEIPELDTYGFDVVYVQADMYTEKGVHAWRYPESEVAKLADPKVKLVCLVNPSNPPSMELSDRVTKQIQGIVAKKNPNLLIVTDDVYGTFVDGFTSIASALPRNTLLVYSYSKHFGATGWRLGVIGLAEDNVIDELIAKLPRKEKDRLAKRYGTLSLEPAKMRFIDRMVADSRQVALNHTAGLSTPQQVMIDLLSLFGMRPEGHAYKQKVQAIVRRRLDLLMEGLGSGWKISEDAGRACYYIELDLLGEAERGYGPEFAAYLEKTYEPIDPLFRLADQTGVVLLNGGGFDGPEWSVRVSLANLDDLDYLKIGHHLQQIFAEYLEEWRAGGK